MEDLQASLREMSRQAEEMVASSTRRVAEVRDRAALERTSSGVSVVAGAGLVPESVTVGRAWETTIGADALGATLTSAVLLESLATEPTVREFALPAQLPLPVVPPRSLELVVEDVLSETTRMLDSIDSRWQEQATKGMDRSRAVTVTVRSAVEIEVDPTWSSGRTAAQVNNAISEALAAAREAWEVTHQKPPTADQDRTRGLIAELSAVLEQLDQPAGGPE